MSSKKFVKLLARGGAKFIRQKSTSHAIFERQKEGRVYRAPVVMAKKELSPKYMKLVLRQLGFTDEEMDATF
ncbi:putative RNA binding protein YcfA, dsRBD-like fold, HicA-like mRNA interferase family [Candidatus Methanophagaceae archaeon]|nr:putative RNA binding protein YcfA, dsRBD-like fold, HicA-like mRNA interferase family [Methanophagales archaeon]